MKGLGYLISTLSVILLGIVAWPKPDEPQWKAALVLTGMTASMIGMFLRYLAHRKQDRRLRGAERAAIQKHG
jgi:uncharacterized membrane protein YhhN